MDRKNINRGFKKLRVWQDAVSLYVLACKIFGNFPFSTSVCKSRQRRYHCRGFITTWITIMYNTFKRIGCQCTFCNKIQVDLGMPWLPEGVVIPGSYINIHGKKVKIDPNNLDPNTEVIRFWPLFLPRETFFFCFTGAMIPTFHHSM